MISHASPERACHRLRATLGGPTASTRREVTRRCCAAFLALGVAESSSAEVLAGSLQRTVGECRVRSASDPVSRPISIGGAIRVGDRLVCNQSGKIALNLPGSRAFAEPEIVAEIEYVVPEGRFDKSMPEGTRPGLRAGIEPSAEPSGGEPEGSSLGGRFTLAGGGQSPESTTAAESAIRREAPGLRDSAIGRVLAAQSAGAQVGAFSGVLAGIASPRKSAISGAAVGGVAGGVDRYVTLKREQAGSNEDAIAKAVVADIREDRQKLEAFVLGSAAVLREAKERISAIAADRTAPALDATTSAVVREREGKNIGSMGEGLRDASRTRDLYAGAAEHVGSSPILRYAIGAEMARMKQSLADLERIIAEYRAVLRQVVP